MLLKFLSSNDFWQIQENIKGFTYNILEFDSTEEWEEFNSGLKNDIEFLEIQNADAVKLEYIKETDTPFKISFSLWDDGETAYYLLTQLDVYLLNDKGQTIEKIN